MLVGALVFSVASVRGEIIDRVLAVVGGTVITMSDVTMALDLGLVSDSGAGDRTAATLETLIDRQLMLAEVERYAPPETPAEAVDREVQKVRARFPSADAYAARLARTGLDESGVRRMLSDQLRLQAYLDQRFTVPQPGAEEMDRYYREHEAEFTRNGEALSFDAARPAIVQALVDARRTMVVEDWLDGLRRRATITNLYLARR